METLANFINGRPVPASSGATLPVIDPATGETFATIPDSAAADLQAAVDAAAQAFPGWSRSTADDRARILHRLGELIEKNLERLAAAESRDNGKPVSLARGVDIPRAALNLRFFAATATQFYSESHAMEIGAINYTLRQPLGIVGCISPWNLPMYLFTWKIAPALAAGNCVIAKPSEVTPYTAALFGELCNEAGLPAGVLNILHGSGRTIGSALVEHPEVKAISFTGGTVTGADIARRAAPKFKKLSLELGGKNPTLVFADADWSRAVEESVRAAFSNQGQICLCGSRIYVERAVYDRFVQEFVARAKSIVPADPTDKSTRHGAMVSEAHMQKVLDCIARAKDEGGTIQCGGERVKLPGRCANGFFIAPTVITGLDNQCRTNQEEIFGPVVTIQAFDSDEEAIALANGTNYGLACSIWTQDVSRAHRLARDIDAGLVWVNTWMLRDLRVPMGGMKHSGVGREGGFEAMRFFTEPKTVTIRYEQP